MAKLLEEEKLKLKH